MTTDTEARKHTPGPWRVSVPDETLVQSESRDVAQMLGDYDTEYAVMAADADLIAAAPDLLDAARKALRFIANTEGEWGEALSSGDALRAAIAKATGAA